MDICWSWNSSFFLYQRKRKLKELKSLLTWIRFKQNSTELRPAVIFSILFHPLLLYTVQSILRILRSFYFALFSVLIFHAFDRQFFASILTSLVAHGSLSCTLFVVWNLQFKQWQLCNMTIEKKSGGRDNIAFLFSSCELKWNFVHTKNIRKMQFFILSKLDFSQETLSLILVLDIHYVFNIKKKKYSSSIHFSPPKMNKDIHIWVDSIEKSSVSIDNPKEKTWLYHGFYKQCYYLPHRWE